MEYMTVQEATEKWSIIEHQVQKLYEENRIKGAARFSRAWMTPKETIKPIDGRRKGGKHK